MRFMMIVKANQGSEAGKMPSEELLAAWEIQRGTDEGRRAAGSFGLQPSSKGARIKFSGGKRTLIDGPFAETKELIAGYWIIQVKSGRRRSSGRSAPRLRTANGKARSRFASFSRWRISLPVTPSSARELGKQLAGKK